MVKLNTLRGLDPTQTRAHDNTAAVLNPVATALAATPIMGAPPPAWIRVEIASTLATVTGQLAPSYHIDALGYVHLGGRVSAPGGTAPTTVAFTLPAGARPLTTRHGVGVNISTAVAAPCFITASGAVTIMPALAAFDNLSFDGITFLAGT